MGLIAGTPARLFSAPSPVNPNFAFGSVGGRYVVLAFLPAPGPERDAALGLIAANAQLFRDSQLLFFGVLPETDTFEGVSHAAPFRWFGDREGKLRRLYGAIDGAGAVAPQWVLIDPSLRIFAAMPLERAEAFVELLKRRGDPEAHAGVPLHAPVLIVPRILEPHLCRRLIEHYHAAGGAPSGTMIERDGKTVGILNDFKKRQDASITDEALRAEVRSRLSLRLLPEIEKAFQFKATRMERHIVACYDASDGGYFHPHRDNTTPGTAHRQFAVSINLNAEEYEGGDLSFPEFGRRTYRPPTGGAVVFSCSLLHEAKPVTRGTRYAFLPFLYDEAGAEVRQRNLPSLQWQSGGESLVIPEAAPA